MIIIYQNYISTRLNRTPCDKIGLGAKTELTIADSVGKMNICY